MATPTPFAAVLFDVDETLYDRTRAQREILRVLAHDFAELFQGLTEEDVFDAFEHSDRQTADHVHATGSIRETRNVRTRLFLQELGVLEEGMVDPVTERYVDAYRTMNTPVPGAIEVVTACARHHRVGVVSNGFQDVQYGKLETIGLRHPFAECLLLSEEIGIRKPDPAIFLMACDLLGVQPGETVYVGDSFRNDVVGAAAAGLASCWFNPRGEAAPGDTEDRADYEIRELSELPSCLYRG